MPKAAFLDRDGTIIRDMVYLNDPAKIEVFKDSYEALKLLNKHDFTVILATNQSGVARGIVKEEILKQINSIITEDFKKHGAIITATYYCPHPVDGGCACRKPNPGMLQEAAKRFNIDLSQSWMVGDRMTDVVAGLAAGCQSILLQNETTPPMDPAYPKPENICSNILTASQLIVKRYKEAREKSGLPIR